jgi:hypothetical protein
MNMFFGNKKMTDQQLKELLNTLIERAMTKHNLTRDDALLFIKGLAITKLPFVRKATVSQNIDNILASK